MRGFPEPLIALGLAAGAPAAAQTWADVAPIFEERCTVCHSGEFAPLGLRLDSFDSAVAGGDNGPVLFPGEPEASPLARRVRGDTEPRMPFDGPPWLEPDQIALIEGWIAAGLPEGGPVEANPEDVPTSPTGEVWFGEIAPILSQRCVKCHSDQSILGAPPEGLVLADHTRVIAGGERAVVVPGQPQLSLLWRHVAGLEDPRMPLDGPPFLSDEEIALLGDWIEGGARDQEGSPASPPGGAEVRIEGTLTARQEIDGGRFEVAADARIEDALTVGQTYEMRGTLGADGTVIATRLRAR
ncbi:c-type cytochrome domain-containing protein [Histidinibacterium aquaticum]|uniref:c-type cytochrome domain-containing protein n=1 Tax=Histidinibacterium aquaticum TaxID=2613962 RepID=UPI00168B2551|nr:c-type cytochrome domain-containing protein [Histidinibacterium aquaticum]